MRKTIYLSDHSLTCHLPLRTPRAGQAAARQSHNSRPRRGPRANKPITKDWWSVRGKDSREQQSKSRNRPRSQEETQMCRDTFLLAETLFSDTRRSQRSHTAERMALIAKEAAWFPCLAPDRNAHFIIRQTDTDIFTWGRNSRGIWRHVAWEIRGLVYRMEAAQTNNSKGPWLCTHTHTHKHRHPQTPTPICT